MEYRQLGRTGTRVSAMCLGTMNFGASTSEADSIRIINEALDAGINFIDTADVYGRGTSESIVGKALAENGRRDEVVLATKAVASMGEGPNEHGASAYHLVRACEASLRRLRTDRIDLYQLHIVDLTTPMDEILNTLDTLVKQGKILYVGTSKWPVSLILEGLALAEKWNLPRFVSEQPPYQILDRCIEKELVWTCMRHGIALITWGPLAYGLLSGKFRKDQPLPSTSRWPQPNLEGSRLTPAALDAVEQLIPLAEECGCSLAQFAHAWLLHRPGITAPIIGPRTLEQLHDTLKACEIKLDEQIMRRVDEIVPPGTWVSDFYHGNVYGPLINAVNS